MAGAGGTQIINGQAYAMYSPQWYAARSAAKTATAAEAGNNAGVAVNALQAQVPGLFPNGSSSSSSSSGSSTGSSIPRATIPGVDGGGASLPGGGGGSTSGGGATAARPSLQALDTSAADNAIFNRAKDQIGMTSRAALTGLRSELAARGQLGGAGEFRGAQAIFNKGQQGLTDVSREQAIQGSERAGERALASYQGDIAMRGQDLQDRQAANALAQRLREIAYQGEITQRGQDISANSDAFRNSMMQSQQTVSILDRILNSLNPLY